MKLDVCSTFVFVTHSFVVVCNASPNVITIKFLVYKIVKPLEV